MADLNGGSSSSKNTLRDNAKYVPLHSKHKIFLSHSGVQKDFVEQLCVDLEREDRYPFFDKRRDSLPIGENFPHHIFAAIKQCQVGVVILSEDFFTRSKWPIIELVAMVKEATTRGLGFKIIPVFLCISLDEFRDPTKRKEWVSCWEELAIKDKRVNVEEWEEALRYLQPINSMVYDGLGEVKFRRAIVEEICKVVLPRTRLEDSYIKGKSRMCKVIQERINAQAREKNNGVQVMGVYGMGGIGKTSICKALCNEYDTRFYGRVCHAELERKSKPELLREVLKRLTGLSHELLDRWNEDELLQGLNGEAIREPVFLAVDNVSDTQESIDEAKTYLSTGLPSGSIVMMTSRSKGTLMRVRPDVTESHILEMPELDVEEAKSLFCRSSELELRGEADDGVVQRCVERCRFRKGDGSGSFQYHPLTLDVLGKQLGCIDPKEWEAHLDKIDEDIFNGTGEKDHPIFSVLRKSYDVLSSEDQLLLMDVALFLPSPHLDGPKLNLLEWLGMVRGTSVDDVVRGLERLRRKSLLERVSVDGTETRIGMHDLWRGFCEAEVQSGELRCRRWVSAAVGCRELTETSPAGTCWENVKRMAISGIDVRRTLERVNFAHFSNVTVLKMDLRDLVGKDLVLDLSGLARLRSLDLVVADQSGLVVRGLPRRIVFLRTSYSNNWSAMGFSQELGKQVGYLAELQHLHLVDYDGDKLPDMKCMVSMRVAMFYSCRNVVTVAGLSTKLSNLRVLHFVGCSRLRRCPGVGDLIALEELHFWDCRRLKGLPNLGKLRNLRRLDVSGCPLVNELPGLGDLIALEELNADLDGFGDERTRLSLPDMRKLGNLRVLRLQDRRLDAVPGFESLTSLQEVEADFREVVGKPSLLHLNKLQIVDIRGWSLLQLTGLINLAVLRCLTIKDCTGVDKLPDFESLISLQTLEIRDCGFKDVGGLSKAVALESLRLQYCGDLERLPDIRRLTRLKVVDIIGCAMLRRWDCRVGQVEDSSFRPDDTCVGSDVPDCQPPTALRELHFWLCGFKDVGGLSHAIALESLRIVDCRDLERLPGFRMLTRLESLYISGCGMLRRWDYRVGQVDGSSWRPDNTCIGSDVPDCQMPSALRRLSLRSCNTLEDVMGIGIFSRLETLDCYVLLAVIELPDLSSFPRLTTLRVLNCKSLRTLTTGEPIHALSKLEIVECCSLTSVPDLSNFPGLVSLKLLGCGGISRLSTSKPMTALKVLELGHYHSRTGGGLKAVPDLGIMFPALVTLSVWGFPLLTTLRGSVPLPALKKLDVTGCPSLSLADLDELQALCPQCKIERVADDIVTVETTWSRMLRCLGR